MDLLNLSNKMIWSGPKWSFFRELHSLPKSPVLCTHTEEHINKLISHKNSVYSIYSWAFTMCAHLTEKWTQKHNTDINPDFIITRITSVKDDVTKSSPNLSGLTVVTLILFLMIKYFCLIIMIRATLMLAVGLCLGLPSWQTEQQGSASSNVFFLSFFVSSNQISVWQECIITLGYKKCKSPE